MAKLQRPPADLKGDWEVWAQLKFTGVKFGREGAKDEVRVDKVVLRKRVKR